MSRRTTIHRSIFVSLLLGSATALWWGCAAGPQQQSTTTTGTAGSGGSGGMTGSGGVGGIAVDPDGGTVDDSGTCVSTSAAAERVPLDIIFLVDRSQSMSGFKWLGTTGSLSKFFTDPASAKIGAGMAYFPNFTPSSCFPEDFKALDVPIDSLPGNSFALTNSMPADATGDSTPTFTALKGILMVATAHQDANPTHKTVVVLATDGDPWGCGAAPIEAVADLAQSARNYNGVLTFVIGVEGSIIANLNKIAEAGGTDAAYDITNDISLFSEKMKEIRGKALGCEFEIPPPPNGQDLDPDKVNFSYTPGATGMPKLLLRAKDLLDCANDPGWYYDNNIDPTKIILCPASCATVQADPSAEVEALFGCKSQLK